MPFGKPVELPEWATGGGAPIDDPALGVKQAGYAPTQKPPAQWLNWIFKTIYLWCAYLFDFENNLHTWTDKQTFAANTMLFSGSQSWISNSPWLTLDMVTGMGLPNAIQGLYLIGHNATDPLASNAGGVLAVSNNAIGAAIRAWNTGTGGVAGWFNNTGDSSFGLTIFENAGDGLGTALNIVLSSNHGTALQAVGASNGAFFALFDNSGGSAPALRVRNAGGGPALDVADGNLFFSGAAAGFATAQTNKLSKGLVVKAWCTYVTDGAGGVTVKSSQHVAGVAVVASTNGNGVEVTWASDFISDDHVCVVGNAMHGGAPAVGTLVEPQVIANLKHKVNLGHWDLNPIGPAIAFQDAAAQSIRGFVVALGLQ